MKANELRIGNYVNYEQTTHLITCINIDYSISLWVDKRGEEHLYQHQNNEIKPIPLTEEWLIKFGFKHSNKDWYELNDTNIYEGTLNICLKQKCSTLTCMSGKNELMLCKPFDYVHQLQNLYFALTGEELTTKLK